jgi:predicted amidophosphoribosyltransferase
MQLQSVVRAVYPAQCIGCGALTDSDFALCGACWRETEFIGGLVCDSCGTSLPGEDDGQPTYCDDCLQLARPWSRGRAALVYKGKGRQLVLALKHGDRTDIVRAAGTWMANVAAPLLHPDTILVPVPLHWTRLLRRRYNQAALLAQQVGLRLGRPVCPDLLIRTRRTRSLDGHSRDARFAALQGVIAPHSGRIEQVRDRHVILVDDVMTSGATFAAAAEACRIAGAVDVCVLALARVAKDT